mmetsp:Transcript_60857/g.120533  ORF Transcript_60857/g.120533 Transcript_60857/m.120533 type:complete len:237 (-) Transcript_60857:831-1541(-)
MQCRHCMVCSVDMSSVVLIESPPPTSLQVCLAPVLASSFGITFVRSAGSGVMDENGGSSTVALGCLRQYHTEARMQQLKTTTVKATAHTNNTAWRTQLSRAAAPNGHHPQPVSLRQGSSTTGGGPLLLHEVLAPPIAREQDTARLLMPSPQAVVQSPQEPTAQNGSRGKDSPLFCGRMTVVGLVLAATFTGAFMPCSSEALLNADVSWGTIVATRADSTRAASALSLATISTMSPH